MNAGRDPALLAELGDAAMLALMTDTDRADIMHRAWSVPMPLVWLAGLGHWAKED